MEKETIINRIGKLLTTPIRSHFFILVFLLNIISNLSSLRYQNGLVYTIEIISLSALIAYAESVIYSLIPTNALKKIYGGFIILLHTALAVIEYFILINFRKNINQDVIDIVGETNPEESSEFLQTYFSFSSILAYIIITILVLALLYFVTKNIYKRVKYTPIALLLILGGVMTLGYSAYSFILFRDGKSIPQLTSLTRSAHALFTMRNNMKQIDRVYAACKELTVTQDIQKKPTIIVIVGESHSLQHSSLYGYAKSTNPLLGELQKEGSLLAYDNATCVETFTTASLKADYSLDSLGVNYDEIVLFPACFKKAGYHTELFDNQYFVGQGVNIISNKELSEELFDVRNKDSYKYDGDMVNDIKVENGPSLYMIHLYGQHYTYTDRYPASFEKFEASQYNNKYTEAERQTMAEYDNACLYNDYVIHSIIEKFKDQYCCLFYFSDHGEEVYELRNFMGHGDGETSPDIRYQTNVPLLVWMSEEFSKDYKEKFERAIHYPISMDDIGHTIIDAAGIRCKDFVESRSFISEQYNTNRKRIVMHSIDYDAYVKEHSHIVFDSESNK